MNVCVFTSSVTSVPPCSVSRDACATVSTSSVTSVPRCPVFRDVFAAVSCLPLVARLQQHCPTLSTNQSKMTPQTRTPSDAFSDNYSEMTEQTDDSSQIVEDIDEDPEESTKPPLRSEFFFSLMLNSVFVKFQENCVWDSHLFSSSLLDKVISLCTFRNPGAPL